MNSPWINTQVPNHGQLASTHKFVVQLQPRKFTSHLYGSAKRVSHLRLSSCASIVIIIIIIIILLTILTISIIMIIIIIIIIIINWQHPTSSGHTTWKNFYPSVPRKNGGFFVLPTQKTWRKNRRSFPMFGQIILNLKPTVRPVPTRTFIFQPSIFKG